MTLNLMLINQHGIWQSSDFRLVDLRTGRLLDDYSVKHTTLICPDGTAVITYMGIGADTRGVKISDWIRRVLHGETRTVDQSLIVLRERAKKDLGAAVDGIHHIFTVGAFLKGRPWWAQVRNFNVLEPGTLGPAGREFMTIAQQVNPTGQRFALGTQRGSESAISPEDVVRLDQVASKKPRSPKDFRNLLAAINRRASQTSVGSTFVSPHCVTSYVPPSGTPCEHEIHSADKAPAPIVLPVVLHGIDSTDIMRGLIQTLRRRAEST